jgi:hypothetical protein
LKSLSEISKLKLIAGDKIFLKKGDVFYGSIELKNISGNEGEPILISSYGSSDKKPLIDAKGKLKFDGFAIIKNLVYVPVGTWANALRARALIEKSLGKYDKRIQFILLDYGSSLQIAAYKNLDTIPNLPTLKSGEVLNDLDKYTRFLVNFVLPRFFDFKYKGAKAGGHKGIGNLSNILGACEKAPFIGIKYMDLMKNWIIHDITGIKWKLNMAWNENPPETRPSKEKIMNQKLMMVDEIRKVKI